jgi:predicted SprT family Zn-dependent metalloprotease
MNRDDAYDLAKDSGVIGYLWPYACNLCAKRPPCVRDHREGPICQQCKEQLDIEDRDPSWELET